MMREYKQNAHVFSLILWAILCLVVAIILFLHSRSILDRDWAIPEILAGATLLIFGPVSLAIYLIRAETCTIAVDRDQGIILRGKKVIPWERIVVIARRKPRLRNAPGPATFPTFWSRIKLQAPSDSETLGWGCLSIGFDGGIIGIGLLMVIAAMLFAFWLIFFVFIPLVIIPVIEVFSPWGDRVTIICEKKKILLRDLCDADEFLAEAGTRVPIRVS